jgi:uncharacterized membrane protein
MKNVTSKKLIVSMMIILGLAASSLTMAKPKNHQPNIEKLATELTLSEDQKKQFMQVMQAQHEKRQTLHDANREARKAAMEQHKKETLSALGSVLDEEQLAAFDARMQERKQKHQHKMKEKNN